MVKKTEHMALVRRIAFWLCPFLWPREILRLRRNVAALSERLTGESQAHSKTQADFKQQKEVGKELIAWIQAAHKVNMPKDKFRMFIENGKTVMVEARRMVPLLLLLAVTSLFGQAPYQRQFFTTNDNPR